MCVAWGAAVWSGVVILILVFKWMMVMLFVVKFVVVVLGMMVVIFWFKERSWLCVWLFWPNGGGDGDVVFVVDCVVLDVVIVVVCVGCDGEKHGEVLVKFWWCDRMKWCW